MNQERIAKDLESDRFRDMKAPAPKGEQFLTDAKGKRTGVLLDLDTYERLREAAEELADIHAYDALHDRAHSEIAAGQCATLTSYRSDRKRRAK
jgi:hypothetical protein